LVDAAIDYETLTQSQMSAAYGNLQRAIKEGIVAHVDQPELNFAMANARSRFLQTGEAEAFDRREYTADTSPAVAAAGALYRWGLQAQPMPVIL
jgi:phage terminase large subunit-like protein